MAVQTKARRDWMEVGARFDRAKVEEAIAGLTWLRPPPEEIAMMPALAIRKCIEELRIPKVSGLAYDGEFVESEGEENAYYAVYGIEGNYKNGTAQVYVVDTGGTIVPVCADFTPNGEGE